MDEKQRIPPPPADEVWVGGPTIKIVEEMLLAIGEQYNYTIWLNGEQIFTAIVAEGGESGPKD